MFSCHFVVDDVESDEYLINTIDPDVLVDWKHIQLVVCYNFFNDSFRLVLGQLLPNGLDLDSEGCKDHCKIIIKIICVIRLALLCLKYLNIYSIYLPK